MQMIDFKPFPDQVPGGHRAAIERPERLAALRDTRLVDSLPEDAYDRAIRLARKITGVPVGLLSFVDAERQYFKAQAGLSGPAAENRGTPLSHSFCQYVVSEGTTLVVEDARAHPLLSSNGAVGDLGVIAYLGVPVRDPSGEVLGSFCAISDAPRRWNSDEVTALTDLAHAVESEIRLRRAVDERALIIDELNHRVKNLFAVVSSMVRISEREAADAASLGSALLERVHALSLAHNLITPATRRDAPGAAQVVLTELITTLVAPYQSHRPVAISGPVVLLGPRATTSLALALHELATNAAKYGGLGAADGTLAVDWAITGAALRLDWQETGREAGRTAGRSGFGSRLLQISIGHQLDGEIESTATAQGMHHRLTLPMHLLAL